MAYQAHVGFIKLNKVVRISFVNCFVFRTLHLSCGFDDDVEV